IGCIVIRVPRRRRRLIAKSWWLTWGFDRADGLPLDGPPGEEVCYFAYGAKMHGSAFRARRGMCPLEWCPGRVSGYRLRFNLEGRPRGKAAPANLFPDPNAEVWGVLYKLTRRDLLRLDASEGVPGRRYCPIWLDAEDISGSKLNAVTYIAQGNERDGKPSLRYITLLRDGARAHGLPEHYIRFLEQVDHAS